MHKIYITRQPWHAHTIMLVNLIEPADHLYGVMANSDLVVMDAEGKRLIANSLEAIAFIVANHAEAIASIVMYDHNLVITSNSFEYAIFDVAGLHKLYVPEGNKWYVIRHPDDLPDLKLDSDITSTATFNHGRFYLLTDEAFTAFALTMPHGSRIVEYMHPDVSITPAMILPPNSEHLYDKFA